MRPVSSRFHAVFLDLAGGQVAALDGIGDAVFLGRLAEVGDVVDENGTKAATKPLFTCFFRDQVRDGQ